MSAVRQGTVGCLKTVVVSRQKTKKGVQPFKTDLVENKLEHRRKHTSLIKGKDANQSPTGLSRPVGNAIKNVSPNDSVYQNYKKINSFDKKEEAPTNYGVARPVGNALQNASSNDSVYQSSKKINSFEKKAASKKQYWANIHFNILLKNRDKRHGRYGPSKRRTDTPATCL